MDINNVIFTENDYRILISIIDRDNASKGLCKGNGTSIKELVNKTNLSDKKIRLTVKKFIEVGFITEGASIVKQKTYILTPLGFEEMNSLRINIFGEVN